MSGRAGALSVALLELAESKRGAFVSTAYAVRVLFPNGNGTNAARARVYQAIYYLRDKGSLRWKRGAFAWPVVLVAPGRRPEPEDAELAVVEPRPAGRLAVRHQLVRLAHLRNEFDALFDQVLSECHRANGSASAPHEDPDRTTGYPMRCAEPGERES